MQKGQVAHWSQGQQVAEPEFKGKFVNSKIYTVFIMLHQHDLEVFIFYFGGGAPKSLQMVIAAMKLKDAYSLEGKL